MSRSSGRRRADVFPSSQRSIHSCPAGQLHNSKEVGRTKTKDLSSYFLERGGRDINKISEATLIGADGVVSSAETFSQADHPVCAEKVASRHSFNGAATPPLRGGECALLIHYRNYKKPQLASGNRTNDDKWLFPGCDQLGQRCVRRLVGKVLLTGEEAQKRTTLKSAMISYGAAQHGITGLQRIEDRTLGDRSLDLEYDFGADVRQISEMIGKDQANHIKRASVPPPTALPASPGRSDSSYRPRRLSNKPVLRPFQNRYRTIPSSLLPWRRAARSHSNPSEASLW